MNTSEQVQTLIESIRKGDAARIEQLLKATPGLADARSNNGISLVLVALYSNRTDIAERLVKSKQIPLDLTEASSIGDLAAVKQILAKDPEAVNSFSPDGFTPLGLASYLGRKSVAEYLLSKGANVNRVSNNSTGFTALTGALAGRHTEIARLLLEKGANPNHRYEEGFSPLMEAAENGDLEMVKLLLARGADPTAQSKDGRTSVSIALAKGHREIVDLLQARKLQR